MTREERALIRLFKIDAAYCARVRRVDEDTIAAADLERRLKSCTECGKMFTPPHPASRFCGKECLAARERRRYRERVGALR
jgi:hypothetical protein